MGHAALTAPGAWTALDALVPQLVEARREVAVAQAKESRLLATAVELLLARQEEVRAAGTRRSAADLPLRELSAEIGAALRVSDRTVQRRIGDASALVTGFPATVAAWEAGAIDAGHAAAILTAGLPLAAEHRTRFEELALTAARTETAGRMSNIARVIAARVDPEGAALRTAQRQSERRVRVFDLEDGMARLLADLPATLAHAIHDRLTSMATTVRDGDRAGDGGGVRVSGGGVRDGDVRGSGGGGRECGAGADEEDAGASAEEDSCAVGDPTVVTVGRAPSGPPAPGGRGHHDERDEGDARDLDQIRADILSDLLLGGAPTAHGDGLEAVTGHVQVTVPARTLAGVGDEPALLAGHGPIDAATARLLAGAAPGWDRVFLDPCTGEVLAVDRYRPSEALKRHLRARDERCRFPGCRRRARGCDLDHTVDAALGGETCAHNLCHLCRRHHTLKHETAWAVRQRAHGVIEWRSPGGRTYRDRPPATVTFVPDAVDPPPF